MADKSAYVPVDPGASRSGKDDLDIDIDADFFSNAPLQPVIPSMAAVSSNPPPSTSPKEDGSTSTAIASTTLELPSAQESQRNPQSVPKFEYKKPATYQKIMAYKRT